MEVNWSQDNVEIRYGKVSKTLKWGDFKEWQQENGLILLYRRRKFFSMSGCTHCDAIELSQLSEEEKTSFTEVLANKVKRAPDAASSS